MVRSGSVLTFKNLVKSIKSQIHQTAFAVISIPWLKVCKVSGHGIHLLEINKISAEHSLRSKGILNTLKQSFDYSCRRSSVALRPGEVIQVQPLRGWRLFRVRSLGSGYNPELSKFNS